MFKASMDSTTKVITSLVILMLAGVSILPLKELLAPDVSFGDVIRNTLAVVFLVALPVGIWIYAPSGYEIDAGRLVIHRNVGQVSIDLNEIAEVKRQEGVIGRSIRTFGVGGLFGFYGKFYTDGVGSATFYATQRKNWVWVKLKSGKNILLTPDMPEEFAGRLRGALHAPSP
ncbi:MAG: hypothetical protein ABS46_16450 [Cytophagaceae bacterium SCN 52-12]|nr:MAG: hypothetical protein ABS46_16450 [Cytophagaceae bacterium SCN 52-12]